MTVQSVWREEEPLFARLRHQKKPLVLYGMGDGADKLISVLAQYDLRPAGIFASDEFVRGQNFHGLPVLTYAQAKERFGAMCVLVSFGTERPEVLARIRALTQEQEVYAPHLPLFGVALFDEAFTAAHDSELLAAADVWADKFSRQVYENYLAYLWTGKPQYLWAAESPRDAAWRLLNLQENEVYLDLGAYDGDTVRDFLRLTDGRYQEIWALEPDPKNYCKLVINCGNLRAFHALPLAIWSQDGSLPFAGRAGRNSAIKADAEGKTAAVSLDGLWRGDMTAPPTMIKFDVEGAEEQALLGAAKLLAAIKPKLALAAYHRTEDIYRLPLLLMQLNPAYRLYLRHHPYIPGWETNIYAL